MHDLSSETFARLLSISQAIAGRMDYQSVLQAFAHELEGLIPHDHMDLVLLGEQGRMHSCYEVGLNTSWGQLAERPRPTANSPIRTVLWGKDPYILTDDALDDSRFHFSGALDSPIYTADLRSRVIVPLRVHGRVFGALNISNHEVGYYTETHVSIAQRCADLIAPYLFALQRAEDARKAGAAEVNARTRAETLRTGALQLTEGMEAERRRLAMDLHDQTLGDLSRLLRRIAEFRKQRAVSAADLSEIESELATTLAELRRLVEDLKPGVLDLFGFGEAVEALLHKAVDFARAEVRTSFEDRTGGEIDSMSGTVRSTFYRIVQEAVNNAMRHSRASTVNVRVTRTGARVCVEIEDDGVGCSETGEGAPRGIGNMRTRAELVDATFELGPGPLGRGTRIRVSAELPATASRDEEAVAAEGAEETPVTVTSDSIE